MQITFSQLKFLVEKIEYTNSGDIEGFIHPLRSHLAKYVYDFSNQARVETRTSGAWKQYCSKVLSNAVKRAIEPDLNVKFVFFEEDSNSGDSLAQYSAERGIIVFVGIKSFFEALVYKREWDIFCKEVSINITHEITHAKQNIRYNEKTWPGNAFGPTRYSYIDDKLELTAFANDVINEVGVDKIRVALKKRQLFNVIKYSEAYDIFLSFLDDLNPRRARIVKNFFYKEIIRMVSKK